MKWCYRFILFALVLLSMEVQSQVYTYIPFPTSGFTWKGSTTCIVGSMGGAYTRPWAFNLIGDTSVFGFTYHKLRKDSSVSVIYVREDSTKKVYIHDGVSEMLLYDFAIEVGDTTTCMGGTYVVSNIDTQVYNGTPRKRFVMAYPANIYMGDVWIEGIGSTAGGPVGYAWHWFFCQPATSSSLCLAKNDSVILYGEDCPLPVGMETVEEQRITVFPNPTTTSFTLQLSSLPTTLTHFLIYDALGRPVMREEIVAETTTLQRGHLPSGIYFWQVQSVSNILKQGKLVLH